MTRTEHLLCILAEECAEVAQRASKAMRFGMSDVRPGQPDTNAARLSAEVADLVAVYRMLAEKGATPISAMQPAIEAKRAKVETFLAYSAELGTLS